MPKSPSKNTSASSKKNTLIIFNVHGPIPLIFKKKEAKSSSDSFFNFVLVKDRISLFWSTP